MIILIVGLLLMITGAGIGLGISLFGWVIFLLGVPLVLEEVTSYFWYGEL